MGKTTCHEWIIDSKWSPSRARIVSFLLANWRYRSSDRTYTLSPLTFLYTIFDNSPQHAYAMRRSAPPVSAVDGSSITRFHREHTKFGSVARVFVAVCVCVLFKQLPSATFFKRSPPPRFGPRNRPRNPRPRRVGSSYYFPPFRNLKNNRNEINAKLFQLFNPFDRSDLDTDLSTNLDVSPLLRLFVNELKRVCTCITGKVGTWKECGSNWLIQLISTGS